MCLALADVAIELINIGVRYTVRVVFFSRLSLSLCLFICADEIELRVGSLRLVLCNSVRLYPNIPFCSSHDSTGSVHMYPARFSHISHQRCDLIYVSRLVNAPSCIGI